MPFRTPASINKLELAQVLFTDIVGYSRLPADAQLEAIANLQSLVGALPGFEQGLAENRLICLPTGDGIALVCFGEPLLPFQFAREIAVALRSKPLFGLRMGLHSGPAYRHININASPDTAGPAINIAQRVMDCGDAGHILASEDYAAILLQLRQLSQAVHPLGEFTVKHSVVLRIANLFTEEYGNPDRPSKLRFHSRPQSQPQPAGVIPEERDNKRLIADASTSSRIPVIGRDAEIEQLTKHLNDALAGRGSVVLVAGEPGIGKTHLVSAIMEAARLRGSLTVVGHCYESEGSPPYMPFIEHLEHAARNIPRDHLRHVLGEDAPEVAKLVPELRRMFPDILPASDLPPEQQRRFLFNAYREFALRAARLTPMVALFEDLHWADEPTLLLFQHLAQAVYGMPMLMVGTYRNQGLDVGRPLARTLESLSRQKLFSRILLRRLPFTGVEQMIAALSSQQPPPTLSRVVFENTEGNPFFVEEVFRHLAEEGELFDENGIFRNALRVEQLHVPESVRLVLGRRLERLSDDARRILTTAAVIGRIFPLDLLEELEKARPDAALEAVEEAERAHLVTTETSGRQTRYRFAHELVRQTLADTLSLPRRQRLHARIAEAIERVYESCIGTHAPALAHHLYQAGVAADAEKTIHFLAEAATRASEAAAHEEALDHLSNAISLLKDERTSQAAELYARRAFVLRSLSRSREAVQEYEHALTLFDSLNDHLRFVETCVPLWSAHVWGARFPEANAVADRAARYASGTSAALQCTALAIQVTSAAMSGATDRALELLEELHAVPEDELSPGVIALACVCEMHARHQLGQYHLCEAAAKKGMRIFEQTGDPWWQADIQAGLVLVSLHCGRPREAENCFWTRSPERQGWGTTMREALPCCTLQQPALTRVTSRLRRGQPAKQSASEISVVGDGPSLPKPFSARFSCIGVRPTSLFRC